MPGITGVISPDISKEGDRILPLMVKAMLHEPFYTSGNYRNNSLGMGIGWACHKGSFSDCLPIWNERKDICLIFSGEHFSDRSEIDHLRSLGHEFDEGNASYLVHLYEEYGANLFEMLNGSFCGLLVDMREQKVVLFNDRFGLNRIYFHETADGFYFASEAKSLLKILPALRRLDLVGLGEFFSCGCTLQNRTLFSEVFLMPGGSVWTFRPGQKVEKAVCFKKEVWENQPFLSGAEYYEKLRDTFKRVLPRYFSAGQRVGFSLTGGLDSRMIMAWSPCTPFKLECYTFGGPYRECSDVRIARCVAKASQQYHSVIALNNKFFAEFPALAKRSVFFTDGAMDVTGSVELYINRIAREMSPIRLTGNYGDEILRGVVGFKPVSLSEGIYDPEFVRHVRDAALTYAAELDERRLSFVAFKQVPWHHYSRLALERSQLTVRSPYLDNDLVALVYQAPPDLATNNEVSLRLIGDGNPALSRIATDRGLVYPPIPIVTKAKNLYQNFTFRAEYAFDYGMPQWLVRVDHLFAPLHLEKLFLGRHKFYHFRVWYRDELAGYVKQIILDSRTKSRPYLQGAFLEKMVKNHIQGSRNYTREIHKVLTIELIERLLIEQR